MLIGSYAASLGNAAYYILLGLGKGRTLLAVHAVQAAANVAVIGAVLWLTKGLTLPWVAWAWTAGATAATLILLAAQRAATASLTGHAGAPSRP
jgi:hypothetical protein